MHSVLAIIWLSVSSEVENVNFMCLLLSRFCLAAVCYGICKGDSLSRQQYVPSSLYKKVSVPVTVRPTQSCDFSFHFVMVVFLYMSEYLQVDCVRL